MFDLTNPYIIAVIIAFIATAIFHFDQKQKNTDVEKVSYVKIFSLVFIAIVGFNYFTTTSSVVIPAAVATLKSETPVASVTNVVNSNFPFANLKIKEGPPDF
jgi:hypothetical protein